MKKLLTALILSIVFVFSAAGFAGCGDKGDTGAKGENGENGKTPLLMINDDGYWEVSYDNGETWQSLNVKAVNDATADRYFEVTGGGSYYIQAKNASYMPADVVLPATYNGNRITKIENNGFEDCTSLKSIVISKYIKTIGEEAFKGCTNLESITIPVSVTEIRYYAFDHNITIYYEGTTEQFNAISVGTYGLFPYNHTIVCLGD